MILVVLSVYIVCMGIEFIRKNTIEKLTDKLVVNKIDILENKLTCFVEKVIQK